MNRPEENLQRVVVDYFDLALPLEAFWFAVPNQRGTRKEWENKLLKALGVKAGVPDLIIWWHGRFIAIELKAERGSLTLWQRLAANAIRDNGGACYLCRTVEAVEAALIIEGVPLRAKLLPGGGTISPPPERMRA